MQKQNININFILAESVTKLFIDQKKLPVLVQVCYKLLFCDFRIHSPRQSYLLPMQTSAAVSCCRFSPQQYPTSCTTPQRSGGPGSSVWRYPELSPCFLAAREVTGKGMIERTDREQTLSVAWTSSLCSCSSKRVSWRSLVSNFL